MECISDLIGIFDGECECLGLSSEKEYDFYLLNDMRWSIPLTSVTASFLCGNKDIITMSQQAIKQASKSFKTDFTQKLGNEYKTIVSKYEGAIGQLSKASAYQYFDGGKVGVKLTGKKGVYNLQTIGIKVQQDQDTTLTISNNRDDGIISKPISLVAGKVNKVQINEVLPLTDNFGEIEYEVSYTLVGSAYNIKYKCGCIDDSYGRISPWLEVQGINGDKTDEYTHGLILFGVMECSVENMICSLLFSSDSKMVLSRLLQFYAIQNLGALFLKSTNINRFTAVNKENIVELMEQLESEINWRIQWLFEKTDVTASCYSCHNNFMTKSQIII